MIAFDLFYIIVQDVLTDFCCSKKSSFAPCLVSEAASSSASDIFCSFLFVSLPSSDRGCFGLVCIGKQNRQCSRSTGMELEKWPFLSRTVPAKKIKKIIKTTFCPMFSYLVVTLAVLPVSGGVFPHFHEGVTVKKINESWWYNFVLLLAFLLYF